MTALGTDGPAIRRRRHEEGHVMRSFATIKHVAKRTLPQRLVSIIRRVKQFLLEDKWPSAQFDNTYSWLNFSFLEMMKDDRCRGKPMYTWGVLQGAALAKVLKIPKISVVELGVAGGEGLLCLETAAVAVRARTDVDIDVFGFDTGTGLPKPKDFRDQPNMWFEGQLPMERERLESSLSHASLCLGPVKDTIPSFLARGPAPIAFVSFDLDLYTSTRDALILLEGDHVHLLPRVVCYFDDIFGYSYNDFCGERLAIKEFNDAHSQRKLSPIYGLRYFMPRFAFNDLWPDGMYLGHLFDHPLYGALDSIRKPVKMDLTGGVIWESMESKL
jgi:hypothetical protein